MGLGYGSDQLLAFVLAHALQTYHPARRVKNPPWEARRGVFGLRVDPDYLVICPAETLLTGPYPSRCGPPPRPP